ncbi:MAG: hypothetical protein FWE82_00960 [Defluviitaleaceae bacterium]|nr:hypothetical protein [Defluviitaleaceae bacterium]
MVIAHNLPAMIVHLNMKKNDRLMSASMQRLGSGYRINSAKDDPAGTAISNKLTFQVSGLNRASENATHGVSMIQTADGALNEIHNMLQRMRELAVQAANDTNTVDDRKKMQTEIEQLTDEITAITNKTEFNKLKVLNGEAGRVNESRYLGVEDKKLVSPLYISDTVPSGTLRYDIVSPALSAGLTADVPAWAAGAPNDARLTINGLTIDVFQGDSFDDFMKRLMNVSSDLNIDVGYTAGAADFTLATTMAGSKHKIDITGSDWLLADLGLTEGVTKGADAVIDIDGLYDMSSGTPVRITTFDSNRFYQADGNLINIYAANGQMIKLFLQGDNVNALVSAPPPALPLDMELRIEAYGPIMLQIGPNYNQAMSVQIPAVNAEVLGLVEYRDGKMSRLLSYLTVEGAWDAIDKCEDAIQFVSFVRSKLGAYQNRLEQTIRSLEVASENTEIARSRIRDTDMAFEMTAYSKRNVMFQAGLAILGQANQRPQQLLSIMQ